jgi:hypothetical protein
MIKRIARWGFALCGFGFMAVVSPGQPVNTLLPRIRVAPDGRTFETEDRKPFVPLGVTYYRPGTGWAPQVWKKWDLEASRQDFVRMKEAGVNCVRVFLSYGSFYSQPGVLAPEGLQKFDQFLELAEAAGIYVHPTGPDHWEGTPDWAKGDRYADEALLQARADFWRLFAARYRGRTAIFAYDLLNEPEVGWDSPALRTRWNRWLQEQYGSPEKTAGAWGVAAESFSWNQVLPPEAKDSTTSRRLLDYQHFREGIADEWTRRQVRAIRTVDPEALVTVGYIQWSVPALLPGIAHYAAFRPERQAPMLDFLEIHFYPFAHGFYEYGQPDGEAQNLAYLESVVREVARCQKPVVVAEFGWYGGGKLTIDNGKHPAGTEAEQARWCKDVVESTAGLAVGWLNWGFYDQPEAGDCSQLSGLLTADGKAKEWGRVFSQLARRFRSERIPPIQLGPRPDLDWDRCIVSQAAQNEFRRQYEAARAVSKDTAAQQH